MNALLLRTRSLYSSTTIIVPEAVEDDTRKMASLLKHGGMKHEL